MISAVMSDVHEIVREQGEYRTLLYQMTRRDLLLRYKQTVMGFGWAVFMPLLNTVIFSVIFTRVAPIETPVAYPVFAYCGLWAWNFFASSLKFSVTSLTGNANMVTKVYFPREILPISAVIVALVDFAVAGLVLAVLMAWYSVPVDRDVKYLFEVVIVVWMFATSVVYSLDLVGGRLAALMRLNPMTTIIEAYRSAVLYNRTPDLAPFAVTAAATVVVLAWSWISFHRSEFTFAENV